MILSIIGIVIAWLVAGFVINFLAYAGKPQHEIGKSDTAKALHILINIIAVIAIIAVIVS